MLKKCDILKTKQHNDLYQKEYKVGHLKIASDTYFEKADKLNLSGVHILPKQPAVNYPNIIQICVCVCDNCLQRTYRRKFFPLEDQLFI